MKKVEQLSEIIQDYVKAYNNFDVQSMIKNLHEDVIFKNISNDEVNLTTNGKLAFEEQALQAKQYFKTRQQSITNIVFTIVSVNILVLPMQLLDLAVAPQVRNISKIQVIISLKGG